MATIWTHIKPINPKKKVYSTTRNRRMVSEGLKLGTDQLFPE
jgi:hypothetical protein